MVFLERNRACDMEVSNRVTDPKIIKEKITKSWDPLKSTTNFEDNSQN